MPGRPPRDWFARCVADVAASGYADDPAAVCGGTWARKSARQKTATIRAEEGAAMAHAKGHGKKHGRHAKKHGGKLHGAVLSAWKKAHGMPGRPRMARPKTHTKRAHHPAKRVHHKCGMCGHAAKHDSSAGCLHRDPSGRFCTCRHRG
jgi:hypothetical protein